MRREEEYQELRALRAEVERLREQYSGEEAENKRLLVYARGLEARIEAALAWDLRGETAELTEGEMLDLMVKALKGE